MSIDYSTRPFDHSGRWEKKFTSVMNPEVKVTFPQFIMECVIHWRTKFFKNYSDVRRGKDWHRLISKDVRALTQQSYSICNFFPHPDDEPLVVNAFRNYLRANRTVNLGMYRKNRLSKSGKLNISQYEKNIILGVQHELDRLIKQRGVFTSVKNPSPIKTPEEIRFRTTSKADNKMSKMLEIEKKLKELKSNG